MKWKIKNILIGHKGPQIGDIKQKTKFAWLPTKLNAGYIVWLERYIEIKEYKQYKTRFPANKKFLLSFEDNDWFYTNDWIVKERK